MLIFIVLVNLMTILGWSNKISSGFGIRKKKQKKIVLKVFNIGDNFRYGNFASDKKNDLQSYLKPTTICNLVIEIHRVAKILFFKSLFINNKVPTLFLMRWKYLNTVWNFDMESFYYSMNYSGWYQHLWIFFRLSWVYLSDARTFYFIDKNRIQETRWWNLVLTWQNFESD